MDHRDAALRARPVMTAAGAGMRAKTNGRWRPVPTPNSPHDLETQAVVKCRPDIGRPTTSVRAMPAGPMSPGPRRTAEPPEPHVSLSPLLDAAPAIQLHAFAAIAAFALGLVQLAAPKGTLPHRTIGWIWVVLMVVVSVSAFWIHELRMWGPWSPIHLLAIFTLAMLPLAVLHARRHNVARHRTAMLSIFTGALVVAGLFTFLPGRIMHAVVFGP
jgi:uncharacterized membrane protein